MEKSLLRRIKDTEVSPKEMFNIIMDMSNRLSNLVDNEPDPKISNENIEPTFPLEIDVENSFENNNIPVLQTSNPRGCVNILDRKVINMMYKKFLG